MGLGPLFLARFLSHLRGDFLGTGFPGRGWVEQPGTALSIWLPARLSRGTHASLPFLQGPVQDSHRVLLHQRVEPEGAQDSYGKEASSYLKHMYVCKWVSPYGDTCRDARISFLMS